CQATSRASLTASRTRTAAPAASCWLPSIRPSAGCAWRSASPCASSSTMCRRTFFSSPGVPPLFRSGRSVGGDGDIMTILVFYGSYRSDRLGIRLAHFVVERLRRRGCDVELIDAKAVNLPMLDRMYKEHPKGKAPPALEELASKIRSANGFV